MAKIVEQNIVVRVSKLARDGDQPALVSAEQLAALEQVAQEIMGESVIVEVESV